MDLYRKYIKRLLDFLLSLTAIVVLSPVMLITAVLVAVKLGRPVVFCQERPGWHGKIFRIYKFRSMTEQRDKNGELLPDEVRLTSFGKKLRATSLDELPELFNILKGEMSIVGPRPLRVEYLPLYNERQSHRHDVRPGLTGYAQARQLLDWLQEHEVRAGIITDGRPEGQRAKLEALGLSGLECVITDSLGGAQFRKPCDIAFRIM